MKRHAIYFTLALAGAPHLRRTPHRCRRCLMPPFLSANILLR
ncbi:TPA: hypothetical protein ACIJ1J_002229 [Klebsiella aerogenes]|nr:hypothetical protein [Klebsiella aerogenes]